MAFSVPIAIIGPLGRSGRINVAYSMAFFSPGFASWPLSQAGVLGRAFAMGWHGTILKCGLVGRRSKIWSEVGSFACVRGRMSIRAADPGAKRSTGAVDPTVAQTDPAGDSPGSSSDPRFACVVDPMRALEARHRSAFLAIASAGLLTEAGESLRKDRHRACSPRGDGAEWWLRALTLCCFRSPWPRAAWN